MQLLHGGCRPLAGIQMATWALNDGKCVAKSVPVAEIGGSAIIVPAGLS